MKNTIQKIMLASGLAAFAALASAQGLHTAAGATAPILPPPPPPPPTVSASAAAQGAAASAAAVRAPLTLPLSAHASTVAQSHAAADVPAGTPNINAQTHASTEGQANGVAFGNRTAGDVAVNLNATETTDEIRMAAFAKRDQVTAEVQTRLDASTKAVERMQARAEAAGKKSREAFAKALVQVRQREKDLRASLKASVKATNESAWGETQSALAHDYGAYAQAMVSAEAAAGGDVSADSK